METRTMAYLAFGLLMALALIGTIYGMIRQMRQHGPRQGSLQDLAAARGWGWEAPGGETTFRMTGPDWTLEGQFLSNKSSAGSDLQTVWRAASPATGAVMIGAVMIGPKLPGPVASMGMDSAPVQAVFQALLGDDARHLAGAKRLTDVGNTALRERYDVISPDPALAARLIGDSAALVAAADALGASPIVTLLGDRLEIKLRDRVEPAGAEAMVAAGDALRANLAAP